MPWYIGELPNYIPMCSKQRQATFAKKYSLSCWSYQSIFKDYGEGVRDWVIDAILKDHRELACHFYIPGIHVERLYIKQRSLWHKAWREGSKYLKFSIAPEFDAWNDISLLEGRRLQYRTMDLTQDMSDAGMNMIFLLLDIKAGGEKDLNFYSDFANQHDMRWVACNNSGARDPQTFKSMLEVMSKYHTKLDRRIGVIVNGPSSGTRIRSILRIFEGREVVISNAARIEVQRRLL